MNRGALSFVLGGTVCLVASRSADGQARAPTFAVSLEYEPAPTCPAVADLKADVIAKVGYDPFSESAPDRVLMLVAPRGKAWNGRLEWRDARGEWTGEQAFPLAGTDCSRLVRGMSLALAVQIQLLAKTHAASDTTGAAATEAAPPIRDSNGGPPTVPNSPAVEGLRSESSPVSLAVEATTSSSAHGRRRPVFAMGAGPSVGFGMAAAPVLLGRIFGTIAWPHFSLELAAAMTMPDTMSRADGAGFGQQHLFMSAAGCAVLAPWSACALTNVGAVRMAGEHIDLPSSATVPFVEAGARIGVIHPFGRHTFVQAHLDGVANLTRWTGELDDIPVWTAPRLAAALGLDAGVRLP